MTIYLSDATLVGRIPYWGYHLDENRLATHLVNVEFDVESEMDWGLLGYYVGEIVQEQIPVFNVDADNGIIEVTKKGKEKD